METEDPLRHRDRPLRFVGPVLGVVFGIVLITLVVIRMRQPIASTEPLPIASSLVRSRPAPYSGKPNLTGLVPPSQVGYGPDSGSVLVDTTFHPSEPLPKGLSIDAAIGPVVWGSGNARSGVIHAALSKHEADVLRVDLRELLEHVRKSAHERNLPSGSRNYAGAPFNFDGPSYTVDTAIRSYDGQVSERISLPVPDSEYDRAAKDIIRTAVNMSVARFQDQLERQDDLRRSNGP